MFAHVLCMCMYVHTQAQRRLMCWCIIYSGMRIHTTGMRNGVGIVDRNVGGELARLAWAGAWLCQHGREAWALCKLCVDCLTDTRHASECVLLVPSRAILVCTDMHPMVRVLIDTC